MDKLKTSDLGGFPFVLDDIRQFLGRLTSPANHGIYQAFNNLLRGFGDNFIVQGVVASGTTPNVAITEGWVILDGELIKVDAQTGINTTTDNKFVKDTSFDPRGNKSFLNGSIADTYEKNRAIVQGTTGNLDFDAQRIGVWEEDVFDASDFASDTGAWAVIDANATVRFNILGKMMTVSVEVFGNLTGGPTAFLTIKIPKGKTVSQLMSQTNRITESGTTKPSTMLTLTSSNEIAINILDGSTIANGIVVVSGVFTFEID